MGGKKKTPAQQAGFEVGDTAIVLLSKEGFTKGQRVKLYRDDGSKAPLWKGANHSFSNAGGEMGAYFNIIDVRKPGVGGAPSTERANALQQKLAEERERVGALQQKLAEERVRNARLEGEVEGLTNEVGELKQAVQRNRDAAVRENDTADYYRDELAKAHALLGRVVHQTSERWDMVRLTEYFPTDNRHNRRSFNNPKGE